MNITRRRALQLLAATGAVPIIGDGVMALYGHNTYLPIAEHRWILNDTYPDSKRMQTPYLFDKQSGKRHNLGHFHLPAEYQGEWRCDTHPRSSNDGRTCCDRFAPRRPGQASMAARRRPDRRLTVRECVKV